MTYQKWLHRYAVLTAFCTLILLCAGALVTGTGSGLAVPDWPLSYGTLMPPMIGGILFEHGHRLIAGTVAILVTLQAIYFSFKEQRRWVRKLAWTAVGIVFCQAALGGLTVILRLPPQVSIAHACLAQIFFCTTVVMALVTSSSWFTTATTQEDSEGIISLSQLAVLVSFGFFLQLLLGASMRHTGAGLAIPDFPTAFGRVLPPVFTPQIAVHFAHRLWAFTMVGLVAWMTVRIYRKYSTNFAVLGTAGALISLVFFQILLGAMVIWLQRPVAMTTIHLAVGALCLATSVALTCQMLKPRWVTA